MECSIAEIRIEGLSPLSQSRHHDEPQYEQEGRDEYDKRTWASKLNVNADTGEIVIPAHGMHQALIAAARYSGKQIPGQGKKTYTQKVTTGLAILDEIRTGMMPDQASMITISANADGVRGSGKRVPRRFPMLYNWSADFELTILDPILTEGVVREVLEIAGMFIGVGRFRPEKGGQNGRWKVADLQWHDHRPLAA